MAIPPDPDSVEHAIKRAHMQTSTWLRCCKQNIQTFDPEEFGWKLTDGKLKPLWFNGDKFPCQLLDADKENKLMVMMQITKAVIQMTVHLKRKLEHRRLLLSQRK